MTLSLKFLFVRGSPLVLCIILLTSCETARHGEINTSRRAPETRFIELPKMAVDGVNYDDGIDYKEAVSLASEYFRYYLGLCGMPDKPDSGPEFY